MTTDPTDSPAFREELARADLAPRRPLELAADGLPTLGATAQLIRELQAEAAARELEAVAFAPYDRAEQLLGLGDFDGGEAA